MTRPLVLIAAVGRNGAIGRHNTIPWHLPGDMQHFRRLSMGKPLILGRRTFQSIGRPLPGRTFVVVSGDPCLPLPDDAVLCRDPAAAVTHAQILAEAMAADAVMVAGGAMIYAGLIGRADRLEITEVGLAPEADAVFPPIDPGLWREVSRLPQQRGPADTAAFSFVTYERL